MEKKRRKAKWRSCLWCERRQIDPPFRSGKGKVLVRHMVECEAMYRLEQSTLENRPKVDIMFSMMNKMQSQIADLTARLTVVEQKKAREPDPGTFWAKIKPKQAWRMRKENTVRAIRACLSNYEPSKYCKTPNEYLGMMLITRHPDISDILSVSLWPILEQRSGKMCLRNYESEDMYSCFKNLWGKQRNSRDTLDFWKEAIEEVGLPLKDFYDAKHMYQVSNEFDRILTRFQVTKKRAGGGPVCQGLVGLCRQWRKAYPLPDSIVEACRSLPPGQELKWGNESLPDPLPLESKAVHGGNKSASGPRSSSGTHDDSFLVVSS